MKIIDVPIKDLIPADYNPRIIKENDYKQLKDGLDEFKFVEPIVVNSNEDRKNIIIGGHQRIKAAEALGLKTVPVFYIDLPEDKERKLNVKLNKNTGEWDWDKLANEFDMEELVDWGFEEEEFLGIDILEPEETVGDDQVPDVGETITVKGDLYELGEHRLLCGDSTMIDDVEKLMGGEKVDMVFTDPPYGYKYKSNYQDKYKMMENDDEILDFIPSIDPFIFKDAPIFIFGSFQTIHKWIEYVEGIYSYKNLIVWKKNNWSMGDLKGAFAGQHELIIYAQKGRVEMLGKRDSDVWEFDREPPKDHPTQKPIDLLVFAFSKFRSIKIIDPFLGSGTTLIACEKTNRKCYGMELDPHYCDVIVERYVDFCEKNNRGYSVKRNGEPFKIPG